MYPDPTEQSGKLALYGLTGGLANTVALPIAGLFVLASWRWYFRFITMLVIPVAALTFMIMPRTAAVAEDLPGAEKWKRMDLGGVFLLMATLVLFILAFTQSTIDGYSSAIFIAPLIISIFLAAAFVVYELYLPRGYALLPQDIWSYPNIFPLIVQASIGFLWSALMQLRGATFFQVALGDSAILAAAKIVPMGIVGIIGGGMIQVFPWLITRPRYVQLVASLLCFAGSMLWAFSEGGPGTKYWKFIL